MVLLSTDGRRVWLKKLEDSVRILKEARRLCIFFLETIGSVLAVPSLAFRPMFFQLHLLRQTGLAIAYSVARQIKGSKNSSLRHVLKHKSLILYLDTNGQI